MPHTPLACPLPVEILEGPLEIVPLRELDH